MDERKPAGPAGDSAGHATGDAAAGSDARLAVTAALAGAAVLRELYGTTLRRYEKSAGDFATTADFEAERAVLAVLRAARPGDAVSGEESGASGTAQARRRWLVDPLCGTLNYDARTMLVAVNVALRDGDETAVAAVADPFADEVFWTDGVRAVLRRGGVDGELAPAPGSGLVDVNLDPPFPRFPAYDAAGLPTAPGFAPRFRPRVLSTTLALAWVAAGRRAAYVTDGGDLRASVHFAAGIALCRAAGCVVSGIDGRPLHDSAGGLIAAADGDTHAALVELAARPGRG
ncbi:inositol monophosphatase family protein [Streptomyces sp. 184]|uniref:inositol monophosphatase family protein n=1 Tax=Streptomyces sp. 184 TaxID=1827526 RepID=UPI003891CECD